MICAFLYANIRYALACSIQIYILQKKHIPGREGGERDYSSMGWDEDYTYRIPCQTIREPGGDRVVLGFDLDDYIGRAINKKEEVIMARKEA